MERFVNPVIPTADREAGSGGNGEANASMNENRVCISIPQVLPVSGFRFPIYSITH